MKHILLAMAFACLAGAPALAACNGPGSAAAKAISYSNADNDTRAGLTIALVFGLDPPTFPAQQLAAAKNPCRRASFIAGADDYVVYGEDNGLPPRWAASASNPSRIAYVALMPSPAAAFAARRANPGGNSMKLTPSGVNYVLAVTDGGNRLLFRFYNAVPDDARLAADMCAALSGSLPAQGVYDTSTQQSALDQLGDSATTPASEACHVSTE